MRLEKLLALLVFSCGGGAAKADEAPARERTSTVEAEWPQFRGPKRDGLSADTGLLPRWPKDGPPLLWKARGIGAGYSSVSVAGGRIYTMGDVGKSATVSALNAADGTLLWQAEVGAEAKPGGYPGPRSTPATDGTLVFALGQLGDLVCVQAATGKEVWRRNLERDFGGRVMTSWGYSESPLVDGDALVVTPGGPKGTVVALNKATGAPLWQSAELKDSAAYSSLVPFTLGSIPQYIVFTDRIVAGIAAMTGKLTWWAPRAGSTAVIPTPLHKDGIVFVSSGYGVGHNAYQVSFADGGFRAAEIYKGKEMLNHIGGLVLVGDHVYGVSDIGGLKCMELKTGKVVWGNPGVGKGNVAYADGHLYIRAESGGAIALVEASPAAYQEKGRFTPPDPSGLQTWAHLVICGGRLYIRDMDTLLCYTLEAGK